MLTDSINEADRPVSINSGCLIGELVRLVTDREDLVDRVSDPASDATAELLGVNFIGVRGGDEGRPSTGSGVGFGINMVFLTSRASRRPLFLLETVFC